MPDLKKMAPSPSYSIAVPTDVQEERDERVTSYWLKGQPLLLQLSSYLRSEGAQLSASQRLAERVARDSGSWRMWSNALHPDSTIDQATAEREDQNQTVWVHTYLVWPHLTVYALVSGPVAELRSPNNWATNAVRSIQLVGH
jgi:hypothetical protein